jgi:hypothetical protein
MPAGGGGGASTARAPAARPRRTRSRPPPRSPSRPPSRPAEPAEPAGWEEALAFAKRRLAGEYTVDDFGFDSDLTDNLLLPALRPLYERWFRVETIRHAPRPRNRWRADRRHHFGVTLPQDSLMTAVALHTTTTAPTAPAHAPAPPDFPAPGPRQPGPQAGQHAGVSSRRPEPSCPAASSSGRLARGLQGHRQAVPERYKLQRFGRGGFVSGRAADRRADHPVLDRRAEETYPMLRRSGRSRGCSGLPYFPITPTWPLLGPLGLVPLPSKWYIEFGEPIPTAHLGAAEADDPMLVFNLTDQVRETIQHTLYKLLSQRRNAFLG